MNRVRSVGPLGVLATWLLVDLWRMFTPSLITLFGRAAETPAEVMGAYALGVMAAPLVLLAFVRGPAPRLAAVLVGAAFAVRIVLRVSPTGGDLQLYGSSLGVALTVAALCLIAGSAGRSLPTHVTLGLALSVTTHATLGSFAAVWRTDGWDIALLIIQALLLLIAARRAMSGTAAQTEQPTAARLSLLVFPALLLLLLALVNVGRASTVDLVWGPLAVVLGVWLAVAAAVLPRPRRRPWFAAATLIGAVFLAVPFEVTRGGIDSAGFEGSLSAWALAAFVFGPGALTRVLAFGGGSLAAERAPRRSPRKTSLAMGAGAVIWAIVLFAFYAGYDLGYRADWAVVGFAALTAIIAFARSSRTVFEPFSVYPLLPVAGAAVLALVVTAVGPNLTIRPLEAPADRPGDSALTAVAYNLRMGYGMNGRFDPIEVAEQIQTSGAEVAMLSEVDRGWLLNGGQDQLAILARLLNMRFVFGPAGDQVWGDVILTSLPIEQAASEKMPWFDSLTGASLTTATLDWHGTPVQIISTHLQPDADDATLRQAEVFADALRSAAAHGPVIGGGDLNTEPGSAAWVALLASGAEDALAVIRPAPTWSAEAPTKQIDHLFVAGARVVSAEVVPSLNSDHLMITISVDMDTQEPA